MRRIKLLPAFLAVMLLALMVMTISYVGMDRSVVGPILLSAVLMSVYFLALTFAAHQASFKKSLIRVAIAVSVLLLLHVIDIPGAEMETTNVLILAIVGAVFLPVEWFRHHRRRAQS